MYSGDGKAEFSAAIISVFSVTWSFKNRTNMLIWTIWSFLFTIITLMNALFKRTAIMWQFLLSLLIILMHPY